ncbi:family 43 glycosylhydrolase [Congregicoccus parvus]|uniref:family 43 glycosylhydrolase n=1 Tax=Congregicoccus parvus TaxID=3081749 RepID=UPI003FA610D7
MLDASAVEVHPAIRTNASEAIVSGVPWFDQRGIAVSARGAGILKEGERWYLFGEFKQDHGNAFVGFSCYSSTDLVNWRFENVVLPTQPDGRLGPDRVGERPKVLKCPATGEFVMYMHTDDRGYRDPAVGYATSPTINGVYTFHGPLLHNGEIIKKWDMSAFQDDDGAGYLVTHSGNIFRLADDYRSVVEPVVQDMTPGFESPAIFKREGVYYWLGSGLTGWERNDNTYFTAPSLRGPWKPRGHFAPVGSLTWNSQTTFVLPVAGSEGTTFVYMGDRWAHPRQNTAATYVWQPLHFAEDGTMSLPEFRQSWNLDTLTGRWSEARVAGSLVDIRDYPGVRVEGTWTRHTDSDGHTDLRSAEKGASLTIPFTGTRIGFHAVARPDGGFGRVEIRDAGGDLVLHSIVETYCLYSEASLKFLGPELERGDYSLTVTVLGERFFWQAKTATYGSHGDYVSVQKILLVE